MKRYIRSATVSNKDLAKTSTDPKVLAQLATDEDAWVRYYVAKNPNTSAKAFVQLANDEEKDVRRAVAQNPNTPVDILAQLANDEAKSVRGDLAENPNTPVDILAQLANDEEDYVRYCVAQCSNAPADVLAQLAEDEDWFVRDRVGVHPNTPVDVLVQLADDKHYNVRSAVAYNPNTPVDILKQLANDAEERVQETAKESLKKRNPSNSSNKPSSSAADWQAFLSELGQECEEYGDPLYEQSPAGEQLSDLCYEVENKLPFWLEPSVQAGQGGVWIYDKGTDEPVAEDIDYQEYNDRVLDIAFNSSSAKQFKQRYKQYLNELVKGA